MDQLIEVLLSWYTVKRIPLSEKMISYARRGKMSGLKHSYLELDVYEFTFPVIIFLGEMSSIIHIGLSDDYDRSLIVSYEYYMKDKVHAFVHVRALSAFEQDLQKAGYTYSDSGIISGCYIVQVIQKWYSRVGYALSPKDCLSREEFTDLFL